MSYLINSISERKTPGVSFGGDKRLAKLGFSFEVSEMVFGEDLNALPEVIAVCPSIEAAKKVKLALTLLKVIRSFIGHTGELNNADYPKKS